MHLNLRGDVIQLVLNGEQISLLQEIVFKVTPPKNQPRKLHVWACA